MTLPIFFFSYNKHLKIYGWIKVRLINDWNLSYLYFFSYGLRKGSFLKLFAFLLNSRWIWCRIYPALIKSERVQQRQITKLRKLYLAIIITLRRWITYWIYPEILGLLSKFRKLTILFITVRHRLKLLRIWR